jgi:hypothetical protein
MVEGERKRVGAGRVQKGMRPLSGISLDVKPIPSRQNDTHHQTNKTSEEDTDRKNRT